MTLPKSLSRLGYTEEDFDSSNPYNQWLFGGSMKTSCAKDFGDAIRALKAGHRVAREGWNDKGMWLSLSAPTAGGCILLGRSIPAEHFWSENNAKYARENGGYAAVLPCITMKTATGEILMGWLASQSDMLANDWIILED